MKKRIFVVYLIIVTLLACVLFFSVSILNFLTQKHQDQILRLDTFTFNGTSQLMYERKIPDTDQGIFTYETQVSSRDLSAIEGDVSLIITRLRGNWHKIYWNDLLIGRVGSETNVSNHIWHNSYTFAIDRSLIKADNVLRFETYSEYKVGFSNLPIMLVGSKISSSLYQILRTVHANTYTVIISALMTLSLMQMLLFGLTKSYDKRYSFLPLSVFIMSIYLLDYTVLPYSPLSPLQFKQVMILALYVSTTTMSIAIARLYKVKRLQQVAAVIMVISGGVIALSPNLVVLSNYYNYLNIGLLGLVLTWFVVAIKSYLKTKSSEDFMIGLATLLLIVPGAVDNVYLLMDQAYRVRLIVYGVTFFAVAILLIAINNYIEYQKKISIESKTLIKEKERLSISLITDELTSLGNHRRFFEVFQDRVKVVGSKNSILFVDIDHFRAINNTLGHNKGDEVIKRLSQVIVACVGQADRVFRYGGEEFIVICENTAISDAVNLAETIRQAVLKDDSLTGLTTYQTVTVSVGIASYPLDSIAPKAVLLKAEKANEFAKIKGRNRVCVYDKSMDEVLESQASRQLKKSMLSDFVLTLAAAIDLKDTYTGKHSEEVARYALMIADAMHVDDDKKYALKLGSMLHDLGKIAITDTIIRKEARLSDVEYKMIKEHTEIGFDLIKEFVNDTDVMSCVRHHHERYDGMGYPDGLKGQDIPLLARIVCVADAYHAMISDRSYRSGMPQSLAIQNLINNAGTQFDKDIVTAFVAMLNGERVGQTPRKGETYL